MFWWIIRYRVREMHWVVVNTVNGVVAQGCAGCAGFSKFEAEAQLQIQLGFLKRGRFSREW